MNEFDNKKIETQKNNSKENKKGNNHNNKNKKKQHNNTTISQRNKGIDKEHNKLTKRRLITRNYEDERKIKYNRLWNQKYDLCTWNKTKVLQVINNPRLQEKIKESNESTTSTPSLNKRNNKSIQIVDTIPN